MDRATIRSLEMHFLCAAHKAGLPVVVCNTGQVRQFAKSTGRVAKTDKLDAQDIAHFGESIKPRLMPLKPEEGRHRCLHAQATADP